ncbi:MAG: ferrochelatase [Candidatus Velthaea sp.]|jgi:ferrochelatase
MMRQAILLINLGSPASPSTPDVRRYLDEFLMDPFVLDIPTVARTLLVRGLILNTRPAKSGEAYAKIWTAEGSPLVVISRETRAALEAAAGLPVGLAMRYGEPSIPHGIDELLQRASELDELVVVPLYPHYAMASTKTVEVAVDAALRGKNVRYRFLPPFYDDPGYLDALAARMRASIPAGTTFVLFSYHGIPERHVRKMDPTGKHCLRSADCCSTASAAWATCYRHQVIATMEGVAERLSLAKGSYGFAFQSRLGGGWLEPFTDKELTALPARGVKRLAVVCPSFVADCLETLEEMEMRGRETFLGAGGETFSYVPCLNNDPAWIAALTELCRKPAVVSA